MFSYQLSSIFVLNNRNEPFPTNAPEPEFSMILSKPEALSTLCSNHAQLRSILMEPKCLNVCAESHSNAKCDEKLFMLARSC